MTNQIQPWMTESSRSEVEDADERLTRSGAPEVRGDHSVRQDAERQDMPNMSDEDFEALVLAEYENSGMAKPPTIPGFHLCWLTTTGQFDTIQKRQRVGYMPVMRSEVPGYDPSMGSATQGNLAGYEGAVTCNEMILHKISDRRYQTIMRLYHHKIPLGTEKSIVKENKENNAKNDNSDGENTGGFDMLERSVKVGESIQEEKLTF